MSSRDPILPLCLSLAIHAATIWAILHVQRFDAAKTPRAAVASVAPPPAPIVVAPPPAPLPKIDLPEDSLGIPGSSGEAFNSAPGDQPMQAKQFKQDQAFLRRDPPGAHSQSALNERPLQQPSLPAPPPVPFGIAEGDPALPARLGAKPRLATAPPPLPVAASAIAPHHVAPTPPSTLPTASKPEPTPPQTVASLGTPIEVPPASPPSASPAGAPSTAVQSDSDSDPVSKVGTAVFRGGKLIAKGGRRVRTVNPQITLAGSLDLASMPPEQRVVSLRVDIDAEGNVTNVTVLKSTGAETTVDLPCRVAVFKWKFEPPKDKTGNPRPDTMIWHINFQ